MHYVIAWWSRWLVALPSVTESEFPRYARQLSARYVQIAAAIFAASSLLWWPTDAFVFADDPLARASFASTRPIVAAIAIALFVALRLLPKKAGLIELAFVVGSSAIWITLGGSKSILGDLGGVWFYFSYLIPFGSAFLVTPFVPRVLSTAATSAAYPAAYLTFGPHAFASESLRPALSFLVFAAVVSVALGHAVFRLVERDFEHRRTLEQRVKERTRRLRELAAHLEHSLETERKRIAGELHDQSGQLLVAMRLEARLLRAPLPPAERDAVLDRLDRHLDESFQTQRDLITDLRPRILDELGIHEACQWLVERLQESSGLQVAFRVSGEVGELTDRSALTLFRVLQETLSNFVKHARTASCDVELGFETHEVYLTVRDGGVGFDPSAVEGAHYGLFGMRERVESLGGTLEVRATPGTGTELHARVPRSLDEAMPEAVGDNI